jgi:archaetidylinositol phosphate synthase
MTNVMNRSDFFKQWSALHGNADIKGVVRGWLSISYKACRVLVKLRITPNSLTLISLVFALWYLYFISAQWAIAFLVLSLMADGLDGSLAIISNRVTRWGAALDSIIDRVVETIWIAGLYQLGAPLHLVLIIWITSFVQEYMRARAGGLGVHEIGVVTISERPIRASMIFIVLVGRNFDFQLAEPISILWAVMQTFSALTVLRFLRPLLRQSQR